MKGNEFTGVKTLLRLYLRRDRVSLPIWLGILAVLPMSTAASYIKLYGIGEGIREVAALIASSPALRALNGPVFGASIGAFTAWKIFVSEAILVGLMSMLTVIKHTRADEEAGRSELLGSTVVGRLAPLTAALVEMLGANLAMAALIAGGLMATGLPATGSIALGLSCAAFGWLFAAVAGVAAQLTPGAGAAKGTAGTVLGVFFLLRLVGDVSGEGGSMSWLSWSSPIGWAQRIRPFAGERWWIFALLAGLSIVTAAVAYALAARRDVGAGILQPRLGPAQASPGFRSPLALAWRLHRASLLAWSAGFALFGVVLGGIAGGIANRGTGFVKENPQFGDLLAKLGGQAGFVDVLFAAMIGIMGIVVSIYAIQAALRARSEEEALRAEFVLSTAVGRPRWAASHLVFAFLGPAVMMAAFGLASGMSYGSSTGGVGHEMARLLAAAVVELPAIWVLAGIAVALFGLLPRLASLSWAALVAFLLLGQLGDLLKLSRTVMNLSPFTHIPKLPGGEVTVAPLVWLIVIALALTTAGLAGLRQRDIGRS